MDFYLDFMRTLEKSSNPEATLQELTGAVKGVIEQAPARVALAEGTALLAAVHDYQNPQAIQMLPAFRGLKESVELLLAALDADLDLEEHLLAEESECSGLPRHVGGPENEPEKGLSKFFLDFEHIETWGKARWVAFTTQIDMAIDIATTDLAGLDSMVHLLTEIRVNFDRIPLESQEQALIAADKLVLAVRENMESLMDSLQDKHQIALISECVDAGDLDNENDATEGPVVEPPDADESATPLPSELLPNLDLSSWGNWNEGDWAIFDQAIADAQAAATSEPSDTAPAMQLFEGIRQNIETLELHRRFSMGNTADNLMEAVKRGMAQDLFRIQKKCPYSPRPMPLSPVVRQQLSCTEAKATNK